MTRTHTVAPSTMVALALEGKLDGPLLDVDDLYDDTQVVLRRVREVINKLDGGPNDGEMAGPDRFRGQGIEKFDDALELLFGPGRMAEILGRADEETEESDFDTSTKGLEKTTPEFAAMSLAGQLDKIHAAAEANRVADEVYGVNKPRTSADKIADQIYGVKK